MINRNIILGVLLAVLTLIGMATSQLPFVWFTMSVFSGYALFLAALDNDGGWL